jgi:hypothetical protein
LPTALGLISGGFFFISQFLTGGETTMSNVKKMKGEDHFTFDLSRGESSKETIHIHQIVVELQTNTQAGWLKVTPKTSHRRLSIRVDGDSLYIDLCP